MSIDEITTFGKNLPSLNDKSIGDVRVRKGYKSTTITILNSEKFKTFTISRANLRYLYLFNIVLEVLGRKI